MSLECAKTFKLLAGAMDLIEMSVVGTVDKQISHAALVELCELAKHVE
jgi:hypothetical protein